MTLVAHCDTAMVEESVVRAVPEPEWTDTWHPISHAKLIDAMAQACLNEGIDVTERYYSMNKTGMKLFGSWQLDLGGNGKMGYQLGFRQAIDKSMVIAFCAGTKVFVCDNWAFSGSYILFRKHTGTLEYENLVITAQEALLGAVSEMRTMKQWHIDLNRYYVGGFSQKAMVYDMMNHGVFPPSHFNKYKDALKEEVKIHDDAEKDGATNLYCLHGAATRIMRGQSLMNIANRSATLGKICDDYADLCQDAA